MKNDSASDISKEDYFKNLNKILEQACEYSQEIFFLDLAPVVESKTTPTVWDKDEHFTNTRITEFNQQLAEFCQQNDIPLIRAYEKIVQTDLDPADGVHPLPAGHEKIFEIVKAFLLAQDILKK